MLVTTMVLASFLHDWHREYGLYRPPARICGVVAVVCLGVGAPRPAPLVLGFVLVLLLCVPRGFAAAHHVSHDEELTTGEET